VGLEDKFQEVVAYITGCRKTPLLTVSPSALNVLGAEINTGSDFSGGG
jgi:hypothetical protein